MKFFKVILFNHSDTDYKVTVGDAIAQLICERICYPEVMEIVKLENETERGELGFGSSSSQLIKKRKI